MIDAKEFVLEYNTEEDDPLVMLDKHRRELSERFKTMEELNAYLEQFSSVEEARTILHARIAKQQAQNSNRSAGNDVRSKICQKVKNI